MTDEEKWRNKNAEIQKPHGKSFHKHIVWYEGVDRRKAFLDGLAEGRKEQEKKDKGFCESFCMKGGKIEALEKENEELKAQLKNNPYVQLLQKEKSEMAEDFAKQVEKMKCCSNCKNNTEENCFKCSECYRQLEEKKRRLV